MAHVETRYTRRGAARYRAAVMVEGRKVTLGTFGSRDEAERACEAHARYRPRRCVKCLKTFAPGHPTQVHCQTPCGRKEAKAVAEDDHWVYRCYDAAGRCLYVGLTSSGLKRHRTHSRDKAWWKDVARIELEHYVTRAEAEVAEVERIGQLRPLQNRKHGARGDVG